VGANYLEPEDSLSKVWSSKIEFT